jgi:orotate phosphoribosyltransferase
MSLKEQEILKYFVDSKAILKGHFILSSGLHSDTYMQCARVLMNSVKAEELYIELANKIIAKLQKNMPDIVVSPAMGGVIIGHEIARQLKIPSIFCERVDGVFELRRGFELNKGQKVLVVEDVITTGKSSLETFSLIKRFGSEIIAEACLVDRSNDKDIAKKLGVPLISLLEIEVKTFDSHNVPQDLRNINAVKPGSRFLNVRT